MTMSGSNHTVRSVPLDLTNKTRERGRCAQTGDQSLPRHAPEIQVKPAHKCSNGIYPPEPQDGCDGSVSQTTQPEDVGVRGNRTREGPKQTRPITPRVKCNNPTDAKGKPADSSFSRLPIRKRPFPLDVNNDPSGQRTASLHPSLKVPKYSDGAQKETQCCCPYISWPQHFTGPQKSIPMPAPALLPLSPPESTDRLLADLAVATHQDEDGDTPLHIAVVKGNRQLVSWLLKIFQRAHKGVDIFNNLRQTPLHLAVITTQPNVVKELLDAGSDPGALDRNGQTALHLCCEHREANCLSMILRHYSQNPLPYLEIRNYEGLTPLHLAVQNGCKTLAGILLDSGAEINAGDNKSGRSALIHAVENKSIDMVNFLIERLCDVNAQSYSGNTALHSACGRGHIDIVRILLKSGADSSLKNNHNDTAIMVAKTKKVSDVLRGKGTRSFTVKTLSSSNGSLSPGSSNHSTQMTPSFQHSTSHSPVTPVLPQNQLVENISERQSPLNSNEKRTHHNIAVDNRTGYGMTLHHFPYGYNQIITSPLYYSPSIQRPQYYSEAPIIFFPSIPVAYGSPQAVFNQSRPSSRSSDQSDMSTVSVNSDEKGVS